jgi:hypothetical protein
MKIKQRLEQIVAIALLIELMILVVFVVIPTITNDDYYSRMRVGANGIALGMIIIFTAMLLLFPADKKQKEGI